jgi:hypothetical protein
MASYRDLLLAAILDKLGCVVVSEMIVDSEDKGAFDPMINRRRIPGNRCRFGFHGWVLGIATRTKVPAFVVTVSWPTTFDRPDRLQVKPLPALTSLP